MSVTQEDNHRNSGGGSEDAAAGAAGAAEQKNKKITVFVGDTKINSPKKTTPRALLVAAGLDPDKGVLVRVKGKHQEPFEDPEVQITVHEDERFITVSTGNTPVS